ncbi:MAG TPA: DJ-1/PfpI family protein, partial [Thermodesulfovibrio thiophilus]|nr:DJ-1/PfpI family protein [Thermodesulfovibrio thiophilus]
MMKKVFICLFLLLTLISATYASESKKVLMIIASQNFRDEEFLTPKQIFEKAGFNVIVASSSLNTAKGTLGATVKPDILIKDVNVKTFDAVVFVGGPGAEEY